ncbi:nickel-responsive transcriptional regulator NikR [Nitratireductor aquimarinus]|uniref:nickel-responsive transcriptional regulator NikR n=1 Tax=Alphaproteobacteria TaxID=28211 RepID=UPI000DDFBA79|nr:MULTISPECIES: nickel-responsive transcriptional regulator NikR [Alphaproteobacteria]MBY6020158.1 nickel-responsive transcriptional regulator NikR [Nitratireductor sp. DP7N14-4]MBN7755376.1 nickel-responsive transcriptional regulator NikR [Nitratireductor aquimarinus]MBN7763184.1 nickel-responsive transcriptional regulator NikR [Nitratireductor aquibiodomus]MBN7775857.1 nickel-responsive transcriptional regulator NikR [Nitratireductor pacificus]MBN7780520.1 nickel-responsive transcriptional 
MRRITVTLDDDLMDELDQVVRERGYQNRSEAIRDLTRQGMQQTLLKTGSQKSCIGVLSYVYDHEARDLAKRLTNAFHHAHELSVASMHVHLDHDRCLEISILKGLPDDVKRLAEHVIAERHVMHGKLSLIPNSSED